MQARSRIALSCALALALVLAAGEICARLANWPARYLKDTEFDAELGYRMLPELRAAARDELGVFEWRTNAIGCIGAEPPAAGAPKPAGERRLVVIGDSFCHAWNVRPENALHEVAARSASSAGAQWSAFNLSCNDYGTLQEVLLFERYLDRLQPDALAIEVFLSNDLPNDARGMAGRSTISAGDLVRPYLISGADGEPEIVHPRALSWPLRSRSRLFRVLETRWLALRGPAGRELANYEQPLLFLSDAIAGSRPQAELLEYMAPRTSNAWAQGWRALELALGRLAALAHARGLRAAVALAPNRVQVEHDAFSLTLELRWVLAGRAPGCGPFGQPIDWNAPELRMAQICSRLGLDLVPLVVPLRAGIAAGGGTPFVRDGHWNTAGHRLVGAALGAWLAKPELGDPARVREQLALQPAPVDSLPVPLPSRAALDADDEACLPLLGDGWHEHRPNWFGTGPGRMSSGLARLVLHSGRGALVLRASSPAGASYPRRVALGIEGVRFQTVELRAPGPFELRLDAIPASYDGAWPVWLSVHPSMNSGDGDTRPFGVNVQAIGFLDG